MLRKRYFLIILTVILTIFVLPRAIEKFISAQIDYTEVRQEITALFASVDIEFSAQGIRYKFPHGIIFSGVRLRDQNEILLQTENLIIEISYFRAMKKQLPIKGIRIHGGRLSPEFSEFDRWQNVFQALKEFEQEKIDLTLDDVRLVLREDIFTEGIFRQDLELRLDSKATLQNQEISVQGKIQTIFHEQSGSLTFHGGKLRENESIRRFYLDFRNIPLPVTAAIFRSSRFYPQVFPVPEIQINSGIMNGEGSIDFIEDGLAVNLEGAYRDLELTIGGNPPVSLHIDHRSPGIFHYNAGILYDIEDPAFINFSMQDEAINNELSYRSIEEGEMTSENKLLSLRGSINLAYLFNASASTSENAYATFLSDLEIDGYLNFDLELLYNANLHSIQSRSDISLNDVTIQPAVLRNEYSINVDTAEIIGDEEIVFSATGDLTGSPFEMNGSGSVRFNLREDQIILEQNLDGNLMIEDSSYEAALTSLLFIHEKIMEAGSRPGARIAEDAGPVFQNRFSTSDLYQEFIQPLDFNFNITMNGFQTEGMPENLQASLSKRGGLFNFRLPEHRDQGFVEARYTVNLERPIPAHDFLIQINSESEIPLKSIASSGPEKLSINFRGSNAGWYPGDLVTRGYTTMDIKLENFTPHDSDLKKIVSYDMGIPVETIKELSFMRVTAGNQIQWRRIRATIGENNLSGTGELIAGRGGLINLNYIDDYGNRRTIQARKSASQSWVPVNRLQ